MQYKQCRISNWLAGEDKRRGKSSSFVEASHTQLHPPHVTRRTVRSSNCSFLWGLFHRQEEAYSHCNTQQTKTATGQANMNLILLQLKLLRGAHCVVICSSSDWLPAGQWEGRTPEPFMKKRAGLSLRIWTNRMLRECEGYHTRACLPQRRFIQVHTLTLPTVCCALLLSQHWQHYFVLW